jgi:hypothetical protein
LLQGLTGAGLFRRLNYPGAPTEFVDPRSPDEIFAETPWLREHYTRLAENEKEPEAQV